MHLHFIYTQELYLLNCLVWGYQSEVKRLGENSKNVVVLHIHWVTLVPVNTQWTLCPLLLLWVFCKLKAQTETANIMVLKHGAVSSEQK